MMAAAQRSSDLVPLRERLLYLRVLRAVLAAMTVLDAALIPQPLRRSFLFIACVALGYLLLSWAIEGFWRLLDRPGLWLFGALLIIDGLYLASATYFTGGTDGPVRYLVLVYLAAVTLLGSYRTGLKVALSTPVPRGCGRGLSSAALGRNKDRPAGLCVASNRGSRRIDLAPDLLSGEVVVQSCAVEN